MKKIITGLLATCLCFTAFSQADTTVKKILLPNGWTLTPAAGNALPLGDLPLNIAVSSSGKYVAVTNNGQSTQTLQLIDVAAEKVMDTVVIPKSWLGLKFSADDKYLYASGGNDNCILKYRVNPSPAPGGPGLVLMDSIALGKKWPEKISPAGLDIDDKRGLLYVVTKDNNSLYIADLATRSVIQRFDLGGEAYKCRLSRDRKELYITCWGCDKLLIFDTEKRSFSGEIKVGDNPNDLCLTKNNRWMFVADANDNAISVIDIRNRKVVETLNAALYANALPGSTTNALALSTDEKTLYVANADNNCLAVFDVSQPGAGKSRGFIPVGWYPTAVQVLRGKIWVANGKGFTSLANPQGPNPLGRRQEVNYQQGDLHRTQPVQYIAGLFRGTMSIIPEPDEALLAKYSQQVYQNTPYTKEGELMTNGEEGNPVPMKVGNPSPIKYVFYFIKENRTYDQVLGDVHEGNGDTSLVLFGERITPNQHALVHQFALLDNFYVNAEVSADGHNWSMGAYATDYLEKTWPTAYGGRGGVYDAEGNRAVANNKDGFIWDDCRRAGVSYRSYGEFGDGGGPKKDGAPNKLITALRDHYCAGYTGWDLTVQDTTRFGQWKQDFDSLMAAGSVPRLNIIRIGNDHTAGLRRGQPTPFAYLADNDLAVGEFVEYLSKSPIWKESVVFMLEDDAQNGPDHVDAHRSPVYIAGGLVKHHFVDHTMYSTTSVLRTIELILGVPPMTQYDAASTPMWRCFTSTPDLTPFQALPANIDLREKNTASNEWAKKSSGIDLTREDRVPDHLFNEIIWKAIKGADAPLPAPSRAAFVKVSPVKDSD
ncbi:bifunctional YncE family protein/alkaline phosphatase family protein [Puia sp.]|jgi:DNA-binding beta-propeller fold protein YncE|uniref:bifunctional YncE family protein/alkaline phosphatase family protein n=1 Tax=Puia sp. TaxID=2045100 RepID=UPI002F425EFA